MQTTKPVKAPRKQRKKHFNAPAHQRHKLMSAPLTPDLIASKGVKTLPARKGDTIRIMRGDHKGFEGKISRVDLKNYRIYVEGLTREKVDGTTIFVSIHPSKVMIKNLNLDDKWRKAIVETKQEMAKKVQKKEVKKTPQKRSAKLEKPVQPIVQVVEAKPEAPATFKEEKPVETTVEPVGGKVKGPAKVKEKKPAEKRVAPVKPIEPKEEKAEIEAEIPKIAGVVKKTTRKKRVPTTAKKTAAKAEKKLEAKEEKPLAKKQKAPAKKAAAKKASSKKKKTETKKEGET